MSSPKTIRTTSEGGRKRLHTLLVEAETRAVRAAEQLRVLPGPIMPMNFSANAEIARRTAKCLNTLAEQLETGVVNPAQS